MTRRLVGICAFALSASALSCGGGDGIDQPHVRGSLRILSGAGFSDSVLTPHDEPLTVRIADATGAPAAGVEVHFSAISFLDPPVQSLQLCTAGPESGGCSGLAVPGPEANAKVDTTSTDGTAAIAVVFGRRAGDAGVVISVPDLSLVDTAMYSVLPGRSVGLAVSPGDTAIYRGASYALRVAAIDGWGNRTPDSVDFTLDQDSVATLAGSTVTGVAIGNAKIDAKRDGLLRAFVTVSVVPEGTIVAAAPGAVIRADLDGSHIDTLSTTRGDAPTWIPGTDSVLFSVLAPEAHMFVVGETPPAVQLDVDPALTAEEWGGSYSSDGEWLYFTGLRPGHQHWSLFRMRPNGSGAEQLTPDTSFETEDGAISPDGRRLAFVMFHGDYRTLRGVGTIALLDVATRTITPLGVDGTDPRWSPDGTRLSVTTFDLSTAIIDPDGGGSQKLAPTGRFIGAFDWTNDGRWLVGLDGDQGRLVLFDPVAGVKLHLPFRGGIASPSVRR